MPYTLCHPAIALPLRKVKFINFTCFILGTLAPDLEYFYLFFSSGYSHSLEGLFLFCLPGGWVLYLLWERHWRGALNHFFKDSPFRSSKLEIFKGSFSIISGSASHILWDSFTHKSWATQTLFPSLTGFISLTDKYSVPVYSLLQHGSTILGALIIIFFFYRWPKTPRQWNFNFLKRYLVYGTIISGFLTLALNRSSVHNNPIVLMGLSLMIFVFLSLTAIGINDRCKNEEK